ncbi:hypothetical protein FB567DRAFT_602523 [Paraphoma chrysanthemicola]|uniref:RelA/SpoT domain-containing protein n=1 Tax=Paraphoma chrysanthemicola TaxID=798071 RepID=A0A8K0R537_9PLEO|nr:hypothetical protein FB567DRAFT_602523 [Paraphoma chrysanthemicola]
MSTLKTTSEESAPAPVPGLVRQGTIVDAKPTPDIIEEFVNVAYAYDHYFAAAQHAKDLLEKDLEHARTADGVPVLAKFSCRAKSRESLTQKLKVRYYQRKAKGMPVYEKLDEIRNDIPDLAGVRVMLYTPDPDQHHRVSEAIHKIWQDVTTKNHPDPEGFSNSREEDSENGRGIGSGVYSKPEHNEPGKYRPRHPGYQGIHYRVGMRKESVRTSAGMYDWMAPDRVEIQVVSALGHVWAEVEHDVRYKTDAYGPPTEEEERLLDTLSGLLSSGELLLQQFSKSVNKRSYAKISYRDDFGTYLRELDVLQKPLSKRRDGEDPGYLSLFGSEGISILFRFLVKRDLNYPRAVRDALTDLNFPDDPETVLQAMNEELQPVFQPSPTLLAPLCLIRRMLLKYKPSDAALSRPDLLLSEKCGILINALTLLQTFAGCPHKAKEWLKGNIEKGLEETQRNSLNFVLSSTRRRRCLIENSPLVQGKCEKEVLPTWTWFEHQARQDGSICGLVFQLAEADHDYEHRKTIDDSDANGRLSGLRIGSLSLYDTAEEGCKLCRGT